MRMPGIVLLSVSFVAVTAGAAPADDTSGPPPRKTLREALRTFASDGRYLVTFPGRSSAKGAWLTAGVVAATALTINRDGEIRAEVLESDSRSADRIARKFEPFGRYEVEAAALGTLYWIGRLRGDGRVVSTAATAFESYLWAGIITSVSKGAFGRERPGLGSEEGRFFAGDTIFPSGHTARSFAIAAVLADRHGRRAAFIAFPVAALIGLSTIQEDRHWASDVIAGAGLGLAIGRGIAARHRAPPDPGRAGAPGDAAPRRRPGGAAWQIVPRPGGVALHITY